MSRKRRAMLEHARTNASLETLTAARLQYDALDAPLMEKMR